MINMESTKNVKAPKKYDPVTGLVIPPWLLSVIDDEAEREGTSRSAVMRRILLRHYSKQRPANGKVKS